MHLKRLSVAYILPEDNIYAFRIVCDDQGVWDESFSHHHHHHHRKGFSDPLPVDKLMMRECPYSTKPREVLRNPSPLPSRFPSGFALGKSLGSQEISRPSGMDFPIPPEVWWSTDTIPDQCTHPSFLEYFASQQWDIFNQQGNPFAVSSLLSSTL